MFPSMPYVPASMASQELSSTTSTTTTTTVTTNTTTTITSGFNLYVRPPASPWLNNTGLINVASMPSTMTVNSIVTPVMTYGPLESMANNWHYQLQEQEKHYFYQANQFNLWNQALIESGNEIALLYNEVERVKIDQSSYRLAEIIDAELKRMSQDLKDIVVYLNSLAHPADATEQLEQICKILNAHMESLQWINLNSGVMQKKVEEVANAVEEYRRKEQEAMKAAFE
ncbi:nucleoporin-62 C-terminal-like protein isoform X2 [Mus musculus]|uniref:nucleoporin-62 C-terminal-like protein isoform X2 n=1 Tax=Mus musculus TaxID=10090 RepID=UPI0005ABA29A|nr:nucleoporin-62 C-terminal-like protein isoform X2 [Mus musculus]|eukprot:XP_017174010.1 PREDICTED: nucleoporin-62 C-terminal-like protein isoform X2 [Mus musculus]